MENKENISRRDALKRMSKAAMAVAFASMLPSVKALAIPNNQHSDAKYSDYGNYNNYGDYSNYRNYYNYNDYSNYNNYENYQNYRDCQ